ncbi:MAG TPA: LLM class flavin-dependent oxidoreductase, partial [Candidatus Acidoferrales bacterium]|nr:LLM class flavin-dependent oxidoreductase [Candidatus Acidoferrales bacterium]
PVWVAVGGHPESAQRAGTLGLPMAIAIIGGMPERFAPVADIHRAAADAAGHARPALSINSHGYIAESSEQAAEDAFGPFKVMMDRIGRERGWGPMSRADYEALRMLRGANFIGSPDQIVEKILFQHGIFGHDRFLMMMTIGSMPHDKVMRSIELYGTKVAPAVRAALGQPAVTRKSQETSARS